MNYKYHESIYAELIYKNGFTSKYIPTELRLLVLYFRDVLLLKPKKREILTYEFCKKYIKDFKKEKFFKTINKALKNALKNNQKLIDVEKIDIYENEINYINSLDIKQEYKKVMFTFLVQIKLNKLVYEYRNNQEYNIKYNTYFKGNKKQYNNIKKISNIDSKISINDEVINELDKLNLVTILHKGIIILNYLENCIQDGDIVFEIKDYDNVGLYFDFYNKNKGVIKCEECGLLTKVRSNSQKYCRKCWKEKQLEWDREYQKKKYYKGKILE